MIDREDSTKPIVSVENASFSNEQEFQQTIFEHLFRDLFI